MANQEQASPTQGDSLLRAVRPYGARRFAGIRERGSTIVESALVYGAFLFMLIATIDFGQVLFTHQTLTERARNAARYACSRYDDPNLIASVKNLIVYNQVTATDRPSGAFGLTTANVTVTRTPGTYERPDQLTVRITNYRFLFFTPTIAGWYAGKDIVASLPMENP